MAFDQVKAALEGYNWEEFGNPCKSRIQKFLLEALKLSKKKYPYMLAVGGGSVIDGLNSFLLHQL